MTRKTAKSFKSEVSRAQKCIHLCERSCVHVPWSTSNPTKTPSKLASGKDILCLLQLVQACIGIAWARLSSGQLVGADQRIANVDSASNLRHSGRVALLHSWHFNQGLTGWFQQFQQSNIKCTTKRNSKDPSNRIAVAAPWKSLFQWFYSLTDRGSCFFHNPWIWFVVLDFFNPCNMKGSNKNHPWITGRCEDQKLLHPTWMMIPTPLHSGSRPPKWSHSRHTASTGWTFQWIRHPKWHGKNIRIFILVNPFLGGRLALQQVCQGSLLISLNQKNKFTWLKWESDPLLRRNKPKVKLLELSNIKDQKTTLQWRSKNLL